MPGTEPRLSPQAQKDLRDIWLYGVDKWSREHANAYVNSLRHSIEMIGSRPRMGRELKNIKPPVRVHTSGQHVIVYQIVDDHVEVIRIPASRQDWQTLLGK